LKLNGQLFDPLELNSLSKLKLNDSKIPDWEKSIFHFIGEWLDEKEVIEVKTSGSTGKPKNISLEKNRMVASALATNSFFNLDKNKSALLCLSTEYIAGKMMIVRAFVGGFDLHIVEHSSDALVANQTNFDFTAVVPLQLESVLKSNKMDALNRIKKIIVGGAALRSDLKSSLKLIKTEVWATYGMTETITHIALQRLNGKNQTDYFQALSNIEFQMDERDCLRIKAPEVSLDMIQTNDKVELLNNKQFRYLGRVDFVINSGGVKLSPEILEEKFAKHILVHFAFSSKKDPVLGEKLVLLIEGEKSENLEKEVWTQSKKALRKFEQPKEIIFVKELPKTINGKLDRIRLKDLIVFN